MFRIAVCDDQKQIRKDILSKINAYKNQHNFVEGEWVIKEFATGRELLAEPEMWDVYFLDLEMPGMDGIVVAELLKKRWRECNIIILTSHAERMKEGYKVDAFRYMTKPLSLEELAEGLESLWSSQIGCDMVNVQRQGCTYQIMQKDIRYLCRENGDTILYVRFIRFRSERSLEDWERELNGIMFFRCHKGYLVNMAHIAEIKKEILLTTGERIPISRRRRKALIESSTEFDLKYGR